MKETERKVAEGDRELMLFFDDELEPERRAIVAERLANDPEARAKLVGLAVGSISVRDAIDQDDRADGIADSVMAAIEGRSIEREEEPAEEKKVVPLPRRHKLQEVASERPSNDNARILYGMAAMAAAVAIGLFVWGGEAGNELARLDDAATQGPAAIEAAPRRIAPPAQPSTAAEADQEQVEVASVDFGSNSGSVFYVPSGHAGATTAVVWVTDQGSEL